MDHPRLRRIPRFGAHRPTGTSWALARGALHALAPDPSDPGPLRGFEREAGFHLQAAHTVAFGSASTALELLLGALGLPPGARVLCPALAPAWVPTAVQRAGLTLVPVEVDPHTLHLDLEALHATAAGGAAAVLVVHLGGVPCDMDAASAACKALGLPLIELFGMAVGARWRARPVGAIARAGVASLDGGQLAAFGGAIVASEDDGLVSRLRPMVATLPAPEPWGVAGRVGAGHLRALLSHPSAFGALGWAAPTRLLEPSDHRQEPRMHPIQAEALRTAIAALDGHLSACRERAAQLRWGLPEAAWRQEVPDGALPSWSALLVRCREPVACADAAKAAGVQLGRSILHDLSDGRCSHAAQAAAECVQLPCHRHLRDQDIERVLGVVKAWLI
jgi:dTDP-4-amino-4,6-dideoxygalactose transaminase